ncbi:MAG: hypothetical protein NDI75_07850 [Candidatus Didemnitutus sp.]|nr:hypothetical protein [Candidatus Didemnitutus sp.]
MTIEQSLRRRALRSQIVSYGVIFVSLVGVLAASFYLLGAFRDTLGFASTPTPADAEAPALATSSLALIITAFGFGGTVAIAWQVIRFAQAERALSVRYSVLADALCISGDNIDDFDKMLTRLSIAMQLPAEPIGDRSKELAALADVVKAVR